MALYRPAYIDKVTGERKTAAVWWFEFVFAGKRYRESTKTTRKTLAASCEKRRRLELERYYAEGVRPDDPGRMLRTVREALQEYEALYDSPNHRPKSIAWVKERVAHVYRLIGDASLLDVNETKLAGYMKTRQHEGAGNRTINMELLCLSRAIGKPWGTLWPKVGRLEEPSDVGQAISSDGEGRLLDAAAKNRSPFIYNFLRIALLTGMRSGEIRTMQLSRIDLAKRQLRVGKSKTRAGVGRGIPMNPELADAVAQQIELLTKRFGPPKPDWYLFPRCEKTKPVDPTKPISTLKSAWESIRETGGVSCRFHDLRHTAATKMAENGVPEATMKALLGHMSRAMVERYSHIRMAAKQTAVEGLALSKPIASVPKVSPKVAKVKSRKTG